MNGFSQIQERLRASMGLDASTVGPSVVRLAVRTRVEKLGLRSVEDYLGVLEGNAEELQELTEEVVIPETWFFRDQQPFLALARWVLHEWLPANPSEPLRVLSLPCATGEEPYSIAMSLLDSGVPAERICVDAVDISERALARARRGQYGNNSFRARDLSFRERHFARVEESYALSPTVRKRVNFRNANLFAPDLQLPSLLYDVIFCRNMLIYFDGPTQRKAVNLLTGRLLPNGLFFVGHAEQSVFAESEFVSARMPMAFAFRREKGRPTASQPQKTLRARPATKSKKIILRAPASRRPEEPRLRHVSKREIESKSNLSEVETLANQGRIEEAWRRCDAHCKQHGDSAEAFHLLGLIHDAAGRAAAAVESYRKALYLEPERLETLMHLALLTEKLGDEHGARRLRERAARAERACAA